MDEQHSIVLPATRADGVSVIPTSAFASADPAATPPALVVHTSGSTGTPKGVALSPSALRASAQATAQHLGGHGRWYLALPPNHIAGAQVLLRSQMAGTTPHIAEGRFSAQSFIHDVRGLLATSGTADHPLFASLVPTQLTRIMRDAQAVRAAAQFDAILLGGASISPGLLARAADAGLTIVRTYGMSETGGGCVYNGRPFPGVEVGIGPDGRISVSGPVLADGYVDLDHERGTLTARATQDSGFIQHSDLRSVATAGSLATPDDTDRAFVSSDLGRIDDGVLSVLGRADDVIISGGENVSPLAAENALLTLLEPAGVLEVLVTSVPDDEWGERVVALVTADGGEFSADHSLSPHRLAHRVRELAADAGDRAMPTLYRPAAVLPVASLPARGIGKPDRTAARLLAERRLAGDPGLVRTR